jgi:hypothetical protein
MWPATASSSFAATNDPRLARAAKKLLKAAAIQELSEGLSDPLKSDVHRRAERSIEAVIRALGQIPPSPMVPSPWPSPSTAALNLAVDLTVFANVMLQPGGMQKAVRQIAAKLVKAAYDSGS